MTAHGCACPLRLIRTWKRGRRWTHADTRSGDRIRVGSDDLQMGTMRPQPRLWGQNASEPPGLLSCRGFESDHRFSSQSQDALSSAAQLGLGRWHQEMMESLSLRTITLIPALRGDTSSHRRALHPGPPTSQSFPKSTSHPTSTSQGTQRAATRLPKMSTSGSKVEGHFGQFFCSPGKKTNKSTKKYT